MTEVYASTYPTQSGSLPLIAVDSSVSSGETTGILRGKRVVIVEDEGLTQMLLRKLLANMGLQVIGSAVNGAQGVEMVLREKPDIVLMDINMPVMNGLDAAEHILSQIPLCLVMLTAFSDAENVNRARDLGACGYILKPVDRTVLQPQLEAAFQRYDRDSNTMQ